jgi:hypothetical protein
MFVSFFFEPEEIQKRTQNRGIATWAIKKPSTGASPRGQGFSSISQSLATGRQRYATNRRRRKKGRREIGD